MLLKFFKPGVLALAGIFIMLSANCFAQEPGNSAKDDIKEEAVLNVSDAVEEELVQRADTVQVDGGREVAQSAEKQNTAQPHQTTVQQAAPERPLTRRERREERRRIKNEPLDLPELRREGFRVTGGLRSGSFNVDSVRLRLSDSLTVISMGDTVRLDSLGNIIRPFRMPDSEIVLQEHAVDGSILTISGTRTNMPDSVEISKKEWRELQRIAARGDTTLFRHSPLFRDTIPISRMAAISVVAPGFGQLYNGDYWKIPVLYATTGTSVFFAIQQNKKFKSYKTQYQAWEQSIYDTGGNIYDRTEIDPIQRKMILHNTYRQLFFAGAFASYVYFIGDGVVNYPAENTQVKVATTLSTIFPGAGQFYNGSYWKGPIVVGVFASMAYVIDWNNRGYQRFERAYQTYPNNEFVQYGNPPSKSDLKVWRDSYRRNRDLSIIITAAAYIMNIIDAHVDAHLRDYDVSDDLSWNFRVVPVIDYVYTPAFGSQSVIGLGFNFTF